MVFQQGKSKIACLSFCKGLLVQALWQQGGDGITGIPLKLMLVLSWPPQLLPPLPPCIFTSAAASLLTQIFYL